MPVNSVTEMKMPLWPGEYKRLVSGEECQVEAKKAIKELLERAMDEALAERVAEVRRRQGPRAERRNGYYERGLLTSFGYLEGIRVPRGRVTSVADVVLPKYSRTQPEFDAAVVHSYLLGHSTRKSKRFFTEFLGELGVSHTKVSRILARLDERCTVWRSRPIHKPVVYLWLDGKYARIQGADKRPYAVLFAYGATEHGDRELLGFQIHRSEGTAHWECMLNDLVDRGLDAKNLKLVIRDDNSGCNDAVLSVLGDVPQQACAVHLERNIADMVHKEHRAEFQPMVSEIFKQSSEVQARKRLTEVFERWESVEPKACHALRRRVDASLVFYHIAPDGRWRSHLKSTNMLERFFRELKRFEKSRQFRFANKRSCERFYYAFAYDYNQRYQRMPRPPVTQRC
jgi:transposase-like protein